MFLKHESGEHQRKQLGGPNGIRTRVSALRVGLGAICPMAPGCSRVHSACTWRSPSLLPRAPEHPGRRPATGTISAPADYGRHRPVLSPYDRQHPCRSPPTRPVALERGQALHVARTVPARRPLAALRSAAKPPRRPVAAQPIQSGISGARKMPSCEPPGRVRGSRGAHLC
jgi:hypothetical protein